MKIIVSAKGSTLDAPVGQRFGLSPYFIIVNPQSMELELVPSPEADGKRAAGHTLWRLLTLFTIAGSLAVGYLVNILLKD